MIKEIKGNLLDTHCKLIAHGVNCQGKMASGVAKAIYEKYPIVKSEYLWFVDQELKQVEHRDYLLGTVDFIDVTVDKVVANCFTQQNYGYDKQVYLSYAALEDCLERLVGYCYENKITEIAMPKIGCGLAGGNWVYVKKIIENVFKNTNITINVYYLED